MKRSILKYWLIATALGLMVTSAAARAQSWDDQCKDNPTANEVVSGVSAGGLACFNFETEGTTWSDPIGFPDGVFCLNPSRLSSTGTAQVYIRRCTDPSGSCDANSSVRVHDDALTGVGGGRSTQRACVAVVAGTYRVEPTHAGMSGDNPVVTFVGR